MSLRKKASFLSEGGEMGGLIQSYDWSTTSLGSIDRWPLSLRNMIGVILTSRFPMLLFWGKELITFYNDAFRPSLGNEGKHPSSLGQRGEVSWAESWPTIGPMIYRIMDGGPGVWFEDQKLPLYRDGKMGYAYWTYSFSPVGNDEGEIGGILVTCMETTKAVENLQELQESRERFRFALEAGQLGSWELDLQTLILSTSSHCRVIFGQPVDQPLSYEILLSRIHPEDRERQQAAVAETVRTGGPYAIDYRVLWSDGSLHWVNIRGQLRRGEDGIPVSLVGVSLDITERKLADEALDAERSRLQNLVRDTDFGVVVLTGEEMIVTTANAAYGRLIGHGVDELMNRPIFDIIPDAESFFRPIIDSVRTTGEPYHLHSAPYKVYGADGQPLEGFINIVYQPYREADGQISGVMIAVYEVTEQTVVHQKLEESRRQLQALFEQAPTAIAILDKTDLTVRMANDFYCEIIDKKHDDIIGRSLLEVLPEMAGQGFDELMNSVIQTGVSYKASEVPAQLIRNGRMEMFYVNLTYNPVRETDGSISGVFVVANDITPQVLTRKAIEESERRFRNLVEKALLPIVILKGEDLILEQANEPFLAIWQTDQSAIGKAFLDILPEMAGQPVTGWLLNVYRTGTTLHLTETPIRFEHSGGDVEIRYFNFVLQPYLEADGTLSGVMAMATEITDHVLNRQRLEESRRELLSLFEQSPVGVAILDKKDLTFRMANPFYGKLVDRAPEEMIGKPLLKALPELEGQGFENLLIEVMATGLPFIASEVAVNIRRADKIDTIYVNLAYQPLHDLDSTISGVLVVATEVTPFVLSRKQIEQSEAKFRTLIDETPFATALYTGDDLIIDIANEAMLEVWGKTADVIGIPLMQALPELEGQPFVPLLRQIKKTGTTYRTEEQAADLVKEGRLQRSWFNFTYKALFDENDEVYGILNMAVDVTAQVMARRKIEEAEAILADAIELAELATWNINLITGKSAYSLRLQEWIGLMEGGFLSEESPVIHEKDRERVGNAVAQAIKPGSDGKMDEIYTIVNQKTGRQRVIHTVGKTLFDNTEKPVLLSGTAQDITAQTNLQLALQAEVDTQTKELAQVVNDLAAANENLEDSNKQLLRSNEELAQYAYVASHDLQEPLRKIRFFTSHLNEHQQSPKQKATVDKIRRSTERMSLLINDLLEFSRLLRSDTLMKPVNLKAIVQDIISDFELLILEKGAQLVVGDLPVIEGVSLQMNQLFYNLIGNALKFTKSDNLPVIAIDSHPASEEEIGAHIDKPIPGVPYRHITVSDNGIGFDPIYLEQIFEVFKRLHGRTDYAGSGIGLAICRRVVQNHQGKIYAEAEPGAGARFHILIPERQSGETERKSRREGR